MTTLPTTTRTTPQFSLSPAELVRLDGNSLWTTSLLVAEKFGKRHDHVLRAIRNLECPEDFRLPNFGETSNTIAMPNGGARTETVYRISRDGFAFLAMGFTGKNAAAWKVRFLAAFNAMAAELARQQAHRNDLLRQQTRLDGKRGRLVLTDAVHELVSYATAQGSRHAGKYYQAITRMEYQALFFIDAAVGDGFRDRLTALQNMNLGTAEAIAQRAIRDGMAAGLHYKAIYQLAKQRVEQVAGLLGKQDPGADALQITRAA